LQNGRYGNKSQILIELQTYQKKKVFITGHTGFKGGWLLGILHIIGAHVKGYALPPASKEGIYNAIKGDRLCQNVFDDIRNRKCLEKEILVFQPDFIFHLAAQPLVRSSYTDPSDTFEINVCGTSYLLDAVRGLKKKCNIIIITTDKVYKNRESHIPYREDDPLGGFDPYSTSKACTELVVDSFRSSYFNAQNYSDHQKSLVTVRAGNVIGGGDFSLDRIIPDLIQSLKTKAVLTIRNPLSIRPWQHVLEPLLGYLQLGLIMDSQKKHSNSYNFGPSINDHLSVEELVRQTIDIWGEGEYVISKSDTLHEAGILKLDISLAAKELSWSPKYNARLAIKKTIDWYKSSTPKKTTFNQIESYLNNSDEI
jgi:CDP-glucose 4,6-dehydratase